MTKYFRVRCWITYHITYPIYKWLKTARLFSATLDWQVAKDIQLERDLFPKQQAIKYSS